MALGDEPENTEDILNDALSLIGGKRISEDDPVQYGSLTLTKAPKEGKANTLLADHLFSPALFLAERIERQLLVASGSTVVELGAGVGLPSLLLATQNNPPSLVVVTDYPDSGIIGNLQKNVERNQGHFNPSCKINCAGYAWGTDAQQILDFLPPGNHEGYDIVILSDLLHFDSFHDILLASATSLLAQTRTARIHVASGNYTLPHVCSSFFAKANQLGLAFDEVFPAADERLWLGRLKVSDLDNEALSLRKAVCRYWIGRWSS